MDRLIYKKERKGEEEIVKKIREREKETASEKTRWRKRKKERKRRTGDRQIDR